MKKFTSLLIGCSLAVVGAIKAEPPDEQQSPPTKKAEKGHGHAAEAKPGAAATKPGPPAAEVKPAAKAQGNPGKEHGPANVSAPEKEKASAPEKGHAPAKVQKADAKPAAPKSPEAAKPTTNASGEPAAAVATPAAKGRGQQHAKDKKAANAKPAPSAAPAATAPASVAPVASATPAAATAASASATPAAATATSTAPAIAPAGQPKGPQGSAVATAKRPDPQQVQQIKAQHAEFRAQPRPQQVPAVSFNQNYRIQGADQWQGPQYEAFRSYHPERHDEGFYRSHYSRVELIGGGYYYQNNGYWYPAWGYSPSSEYYAYDGPIYVGHRSEPPDRVIADVQAELQQMGYYRGEVDGLLGPLTRQALTAYQSQQGLARTAAIDEPTLDALGMG